MHHDEYQAGFAHRTRDNRPRLIEITDGNQAIARPSPRPPLTDAEIEALADRILARLHCQHRAIRERSVAGVLTDRECIDCGDLLPSREFE